MTQPRNDDVSDIPLDSFEDDSAPVTPDQIKVLIVDDSAMMRRLLARALTDLGFTKILVSEDGAAGLAAAEREAPDIIISDYDMPGMHGLEFIEAVRSNEALDQTAIIMLSAADDQGVVESARDLGADTFMVKPFGTADLKDLIGTLYQRFNCAQIVWPD
ncbi:MAG: response regulator [Pseudomonadota bacterium]|nr:response regulator [Pseudomonadota bacterium]